MAQRVCAAVHPENDSCFARSLLQVPWKLFLYLLFWCMSGCVVFVCWQWSFTAVESAHSLTPQLMTRTPILWFVNIHWGHNLNSCLHKFDSPRQQLLCLLCTSYQIGKSLWTVWANMCWQQGFSHNEIPRKCIIMISYWPQLISGVCSCVDVTGLVFDFLLRFKCSLSQWWLLC